MSQNVVRLDVREDIRLGREPFARIMQTVAQLRKGEALLLLAPFEPAPLYGVLGQRGFSHQAKPIETGGWEVLFQRDEVRDLSQTPPPECPARPSRGVLEVDARGLEPPQPMIRILEALSSLPEHSELHARTDRRPMHLYAQLEERGFAAESQEQEDGSYLTFIRRG
jgi:uncharacterized protein (DUF2249 family)